MGDLSDNRMTAASSNLRRKAICYFLAVGTAVSALAVITWRAASDKSGTDKTVGRNHPSGAATSGGSEPLPPPAASRFRNASTSVAYVGNRVCSECHPGQHRSYLQTAHSRSLMDVDPSQSAPNGEIHHQLSGRYYRVYRDGNALRHREFIRDRDGREVVLADHPLRYVVGSGHFAQTYLVDIDGYLFESPVTWFASKKTWGMSPGYADDPRQRGFSRVIEPSCMHCHAGRVESINANVHRYRIFDRAISCERCHGPGALHVEQRRAGRPIEGGIDDTIVNLKHLSRKRREDVCAQCHLTSSADVEVRGRSVSDFRPGLRMSDFRVGFRSTSPDSQMTVVGHVEQMRLSRCYVESKTMTCTTCHDPHSRPAEPEAVAYYRNKCLECHQTDSCGLPRKSPRRRQRRDNCVACHMPKGPTEVPHLAFTHHRIGIHKSNSPPRKPDTDIALVPIDDISRYPELERRRLLALANEQYRSHLTDDAVKNPDHALAQVFRERARLMLEEVSAGGLKDPKIETLLSGTFWRKQPDRCIAHAEAALRSKHIAPTDRRDALFFLASSHFDAGRFDQALPRLQELTRIERSAVPLMLLAICHQKNGQLKEAASWIRKAITITPYRADLHVYLASVYRQMGKTKEAEFHQQRARLLSRTVPQPQ